MELGKQIRQYRSSLGLSQEELAEKVYVSRQSISNWENDKNYPDINSLLRLSEVFGVSLDTLIKGDLSKMKNEIRAEDKREFEKLSRIYAVLLILALLTPLPLVHFLGWVGGILWGVLMAITLYVAFMVEKLKKQFDIQTYKEIVAFTEGKPLDELQKTLEEAKRPYQKVLLAIASGAIALLVMILLGLLLN